MPKYKKNLIKNEPMSNFFNVTYKIKNKKIQSRFFLAPINTGFADGGVPTEKLIKFHSDRSGKGIGICYVGNVAIDSAYTTNKNTLYFGNDLKNWDRLIKIIKDNNSIAAVQIACRYSNIKPLVNMELSIEGQKKYIELTQKEIMQLKKEELIDIENKYIKSAQLAYSLGFDIIQIHAAHGYFLSQILEEKLNLRNDCYGTNKLLLIENIVKKIRKLIPNIVLDIRISFNTGFQKSEKDFNYKNQLIKRIATLDVDIISISNGFYNIDKKLIYPPKEKGHCPYLNQGIEIAKKHPNKIWNIAGNIWDLNLLSTVNIPDNVSFSIARGLIADPYIVQKAINGDNDNLCLRCDACHYYSLGNPELSCKNW